MKQIKQMKQMKQMKKNSKQVEETLGSSVYILSGNLEVKDQDLPNKFGLFYLELQQRIVSVLENQVSSMSYKIPENFVSEMRERLIEQNDSNVLAIISSEDEEKVVHVKKIKVVKKKGKKVLKITTSVEELEASGNYAENSVNLDLVEGNVTLFIWIGGGIGPLE